MKKYFVKTCYDCGSNTKVVDSRERELGQLYRRRKCLKCGFTFSTIEIDCSMSNDYDLLEELNQLRKENESLKIKIRQAKDILGGLNEPDI